MSSIPARFCGTPDEVEIKLPEPKQPPAKRPRHNAREGLKDLPKKR